MIGNNGYGISTPAARQTPGGNVAANLRSYGGLRIVESNGSEPAEARRPWPGDDYVLPFGRAAIRLEGDALTVVTWGAMVHRCVAAAEGFPGRVTVIDLRTICPWDRETVIASVAATGRALAW